MKEQFIIMLNDLTKELGLVTSGVYMMLRKHMNNETKQCFPSLELLSQETGLAVRHVRNHLKKLQDGGYIKITKENRHNVYTFIKTTKNFEPASIKFLESDEYTLQEKMAILGQQQEMIKDASGTGTIWRTDCQRAELLNTSIHTLKKIDASLEKKGVMSLALPIKNSQTGLLINGHIFNLSLVEQAIACQVIKNTEDISEHENRLNNIEKDYVKKSDIEKYIKEYLHQKNIESAIDVDIILD